MVVLFDISWIVFAVILLGAMIGGAALNIAMWLVENIFTVVIISLILAAIIFIITFFCSGKRWIPAVASIIFSSQLCLMIAYGLYQVTALSTIAMIIVFLIWALYVFMNLTCGFNVIMYIWDEYEDSEGVGYMPAFLIGGLGAIGWVINAIFLF